MFRVSGKKILKQEQIQTIHSLEFLNLKQRVIPDGLPIIVWSGDGDLENIEKEQLENLKKGGKRR